MLPGSPQIIACPNCGRFLRRRTWQSGNTFGVKLYTDGRQVAPMMPWEPPVCRCAHCHEFFWISKASKVGTLDDDEDSLLPSEWKDAPEAMEASEAEYYQAINSGFAKDRDEEHRLRMLAWWRSNDSHREPGQTSSQTPSELPDRANNLRRLYELLGNDEQPESVILRSELLRELGLFSEAQALLSNLSNPSFLWVTVQLIGLCETKDKRVRELAQP